MVQLSVHIRGKPGMGGIAEAVLTCMNLPGWTKLLMKKENNNHQ